MRQSLSRVHSYVHQWIRYSMHRMNILNIVFAEALYLFTKFKTTNLQTSREWAADTLYL